MLTALAPFNFTLQSFCELDTVNGITIKEAISDRFLSFVRLNMVATSPVGSFTLTGYFPLSGGHILPTTGPTHYASYNTYVVSNQGNNDLNCLGTVRMYCPSNQPIPDGSVWYGQVRAQGPINQQAGFLLDVSGDGGLVTGNPLDDNYAQNLPPPDSQFAHILGHISSAGYIDINTPLGAKRGMRIDTEEYVQGQVSRCSI
jgi:hypothetical protein